MRLAPFAIALAAVASACAPAGNPPVANATSKVLPTGRVLDPAGRIIDVGNMPLAIAVAPDKRHAAILLSGWRQRGLQIVDLAGGVVAQTLPQRGAFLGVAFSPDGKSIYTSGGGRDVVYRYSWDGSRAALADSVVIAPLDTLHPRFVGGIAFASDGRRLYVAENMADSIAVIDLVTRRVEQRVSTGHYPYAVLVAPGGDVYVSSWGASSVDVFRATTDGRLSLARRIAARPHPAAMALNRAGTRLFVVSSGTDHTSVVNPHDGRVIAELVDPAPSGPSEGSTPDAVTLSQDESMLFVAEADNNAIAVFDVSRLRESTPAAPIGRIPVLWYPAAMALAGDSLIVVNGKGRGTNPNSAGPPNELDKADSRTYVLGQLNGTLSILSVEISANELSALSTRVAHANGWDAQPRRPAHPPFEHAILIIKENRTYDQVFGDLPIGDGDPSLVFFPPGVSPNHRALAKRFGLYDRFFTNAEVSSQGHPWSTSAYVTEYTEKTVQLVYGLVRPDKDEGEVDTPATGYLWDEATRKGITLRNYGEYADVVPSKAGSTQPIKYRATRPGLVKYTNEDYPSFDMAISDQRRADVWLAEFARYVRTGNLPTLEILHLPRDHTAGSHPGMCTPLACFADNDLALGRIVEALSRSPFWKNTVVFVVEDDSQAGPDHFDSHRSVAFTISAWSKPGLIHRFVNTTDILATIEEILGLDALSQFDHYGRPLHDVWSDKPDLSPYVALVPSHPIDEVNTPRAVGARESLRFDLSHADRIDDALFNRLLWKVVKGERIPYPGTRRSSTLDIVRDR
jgi:YVTN family beta-propeller protein